jgi:TonB family protein
MINRLQSSSVIAPSSSRRKLASFGIFSLVLGALLLNPLAAHADDRAVVHKVPPIYPEMAKRLHITGTVKVVTTVDAAGSVTKVEGQGSNKILSSAAEDAINQWKFAAGSGSDTMTIQINFDN